jgi:hypothetical protein
LQGAVARRAHKKPFGESTRTSLKPSEYFARQCHLGSSFIRRPEVDIRHAVGVDWIMWGRISPEGCWPYSPPPTVAFSGVPENELGAMVGVNAADVYGFTSRPWRRSPPSSALSLPKSPNPRPR